MIMYRKAKQKIYNLIRDDDTNNIYGNIFDGVIITLIIINILSVIADTFSMPSWYATVSRTVETVSVVIFSAEYLLRLLTADLKYPNSNRMVARLSQEKRLRTRTGTGLLPHPRNCFHRDVLHRYQPLDYEARVCGDRLPRKAAATGTVAV